jgi:hypothetical protein
MAKLKKLRVRQQDIHHGKVMYHVDAYTGNITRMMCLGTIKPERYEKSSVKVRCALTDDDHYHSHVYLHDLYADNRGNRLKGYFHTLQQAQQFLQYCKKEPIIQSLIEFINNLDCIIDDEDYDYYGDY